ncbi:nucleotidyltransferase substrate binding protein [Algoriphagus persicinus]|uniref:nucleotidyltransferase substrate binding protein n=1 Tax=Algoriphagus persicinus TaxID=3108754 RepID=UPI002B3BAB48|nr:nucleotidyltransferase substrate binding protein [Algoriphagus sp. E1-3-M2]MEB2786873.1 nucleotidyltransferase substrate binding protein [Algoriphagus sp. E1-3-M2]
MENDIRWKQRFENFSKAVKLLEEVQSLDLGKISQLEKEGIIQRFEFTLELGWKTLKDRMESDGLVLPQISPKIVVKEAFKAKYIDRIEIWIDMINDRNLLSHTYDFTVMEEVIPDIQKRYSAALSDLLKLLK